MSQTKCGDLLLFSFCLFFLFFSFLFFLHFFFFRPKFCPDEFSVTTGLIVLKFGDMLDMDVKLCNRVSKFQMSDSNAGTWACPKPLKCCPNYISTTPEGIVLGVPEHVPPLHFMKGFISLKPFRSPPLNHI